LITDGGVSRGSNESKSTGHETTGEGDNLGIIRGGESKEGVKPFPKEVKSLCTVRIVRNERRERRARGERREEAHKRVRRGRQAMVV